MSTDGTVRSLTENCPNCGAVKARVLPRCPICRKNANHTQEPESDLHE